MNDINQQRDQAEVAKLLIDLADKDFSRRLSSRFTEIRSKTIFYQSFSLAMIAAHVAAWQLLGVDRTIEIIASSISAGLFCSVLFLSVLSMSGANYRSAALKDYRNWLETFNDDGLGQVGIYSDILNKYDVALNDLVIVDQTRSVSLRRINRMTLMGLVLSAVSLVLLI